jgi:hypothetical protein
MHASCSSTQARGRGAALHAQTRCSVAECSKDVYSQHRCSTVAAYAGPEVIHGSGFAPVQAMLLQQNQRLPAWQHAGHSHVAVEVTSCAVNWPRVRVNTNERSSATGSN